MFKAKTLVVSLLSISLGLVSAPLFARPTPYTQKESDIQTKIPKKEIQEFVMALALTKRFYIKDVNDKKLFDNAISGMLNQLDGHSSYLSEKAMKELQETTDGEFSGIGIELNFNNGMIEVVAPILDSPADKAGIKTGDKIIQIEGKLIKDMDLAEAISRIRGKKGTNVKLTIIRESEKKPLEINVTRNDIKVQNVKSKLLDKDYGYIRIAFFQGNVDQEVKKAFEKLKLENPNLKGLIVDLRGNPGGLLEQGFNVADLFIDTNKYKGKNNDLIVFTKGRVPSANLKFKGHPGDILEGKPMIVMVDRGSASASEIVAGALQDYHRAAIVGTKTFGKGSVQTVLPISPTSAIKLTTALYYTPKGREIQLHGIIPDVYASTQELKKDKDKNKFNIDESSLNALLGSKERKLNDLKRYEASAEASDKMAQEDYQQFMALNILKALAAHSGMNAKK